MKVKWMSYDKAENLKCEDFGSLGGLPKSITLKEYLDNFLDEWAYLPTFLALYIRKKGYLFGGDSHQNDNFCCPVIYKHGKPIAKFNCSYRGWADFMHCIHIDKDNDDLGYMTFYMDCEIPPEFVIKKPRGTILQRIFA